MVTQGMYNEGIRCKGMCLYCKEDFDNCYQYITDIKGVKLNCTTEENMEEEWIVCAGNNATFPTIKDCTRFDDMRKEHFYTFLVTKKHRGIRTTSQACYRIGENHSFWYRDGSDLSEIDNIIAWKPLPKAYNGPI